MTRPMTMTGRQIGNVPIGGLIAAAGIWLFEQSDLTLDFDAVAIPLTTLGGTEGEPQSAGMTARWVFISIGAALGAWSGLGRAADAAGADRPSGARRDPLAAMGQSGSRFYPGQGRWPYTPAAPPDPGPEIVDAATSARFQKPDNS